MGSTSSETPPSSSACRTDQESSHQKEHNRSSTSGNVEDFLFSCCKPKPKLPRDSDSDSDEVDRLTRSINDDMEFISKVSEKIKDYEDEIPELKRNFDESLGKAMQTTSDDHLVVTLADDLWDLHRKVTNLKEGMTAKESEAKALKKMIRTDQDFITEVCDKTRTYMENAKKSKEDRLNKLEIYGGTVVEFRDLKRKVTKDKQQISSNRKDESKEEEEEEEEEPGSTRYDQSRSHVIGTGNVKGGHAALEKMPNLSKSSAFAQSSAFKDFKARYDELRIELKQCLLCFSVFPENAEIKKRVMTYWWIGEGFVPPVPPSEKKQNNHNNSSRTPADYANDFFYELIAQDFIQSSSKSSPGLASQIGVKTCKMNPFVRSMVIVLAKSVNFFDFDDNMNVTSDYSSSHRACLTGKVLDFNTRNLESLYTLFNVSEPVLVFNPEWFPRMKFVEVLYLGRWETSSTYHVDILPSKSMKLRSSNVLDGLGHVKALRFLSLQRMSKMTSLPTSILKLENLTILDIRACQNLEEIPGGIGSLKNLTHLDMSECYLLDHMPKGLSLLVKLQVLGGFVVGKSDHSPRGPQCTLADLRYLTKLRKLSIDTNVRKFPTHDQLCDLYELNTICKLTIAWGRGDAQKDGKDNEAQESVAADKEKVPCFPWLKASKCPWDKKNASPKENSAPEPPLAVEIGKDHSAPTLAPPTKEASKDNSAPKSTPAAGGEIQRDNSAPELATTTEETQRDSSTPKLAVVDEARKDDSAQEPTATKEIGKAVEEVGKDSSAPEPPLVVEGTKKGNNAPEPTQAEEVKATEPTLTEEVPKSNSTALALIGAEEIRKDNSIAEPPTTIQEGEKDNSASKPTSRAKEYEECKIEQEQKTTEVKAAATVEEQVRTTSKEKHVCFPWMKALKRSRVDGVKTQPPPTKVETSTNMHDQSKAEHLSGVGKHSQSEAERSSDAVPRQPGSREAKLPSSLEKLDLQCFPDSKETEDWLKPRNLRNLKKLYIRGGKCFDLGANSGAGDGGKGTNQIDQEESWKVKVLRLKYLADLKMEWNELQRLFPNLSYLETVNCPKLSFFPCDENGVWMKK